MPSPASLCGKVLLAPKPTYNKRKALCLGVTGRCGPTRSLAGHVHVPAQACAARSPARQDSEAPACLQEGPEALVSVGPCGCWNLPSD